MKLEAEAYSSSSHQLKMKYKDKKWYQFWYGHLQPAPDRQTDRDSDSEAQIQQYLNKRGALWVSHFHLSVTCYTRLRDVVIQWIFINGQIIISVYHRHCRPSSDAFSTMQWFRFSSQQQQPAHKPVNNVKLCHAVYVFM